MKKKTDVISESVRTRDPIFIVPIDGTMRFKVFDRICFSPSEDGKCSMWIDDKLLDWNGMTGRQQMLFLNRITGSLKAMFKRARKKDVVESYAAELND